MRSRQSISVLCAAAALAVSAGSASASVIFTTGNAQYYNVNIAAATNAYTIIGDIGNTGAQMSFNTMMGPYPSGSGTNIMMHCQNGVAFCESYADSLASTGNHTGFSSITLTALGMTAWTAGDFSLDLLGRIDGTVTFNTDSGGPFNFAIDATGQNHYNFYTLNGDAITSIVITTTTPYNLADIKQVSLQPVTRTPVPEPATIALLGAGLIGFEMMRRRKKRIA